MKGTVSVIIPIYINSDEILDLLSDCVLSLNGYDELILQFDKTGEGFAKTVNAGVKRSMGEYIAIVNDDTKMLEGSIRDMCFENTICRPIDGGKNRTTRGSFVVMSKEVWNLVGGFDEDFKQGLYEDDLFKFIAKQKGVKFVTSPIKIWHKGSATIKNMDYKEIRQRNLEIYQQKIKQWEI